MRACLVAFVLSFACLAAADDLLVCSLLSDQVLRYSSTGSYIGVFASGPQIDGPEGIAVGPDGNVYVASEYSGNVTKWSTSGAYLGEFVSIGTAGLAGEQDLEFGPDGNLYVMSHIALSPDSAWKFDGTTGAFISMHGLGGGPGHVHGMAWRSSDSDLYQVNLPGPGGTVNHFDGVTGAFEGAFTSGPEMAIANDLLWGPDGNLYVSNPLVSSVLAGGIARYNGVSGAYMGIFSSVGEPTSTWGMAFHDGYIYYTAGSGVARVLASSGGTASAFVTPGLGGLAGGAGIVFVVPEPSSFLLISFGLAMIGLRKRSRR